MQLPQSLHTEPVSDELRSFIQTLLDKFEQQRLRIEKQQKEIEALQDELRHLKKLKGKPRIRPNTPDQSQDDESRQPDEQNTVAANTTEASGKNSPPKAKRQSSRRRGETSAPEKQVNQETFCRLDGVQPGWRNKGYRNFYFTEISLSFSTTRYRRECWQTPSGDFLTAPLPPHVKSHFGDQLKSHVLDLYHSCGVTQPLLLSWLHDHGCRISEGTLNSLLTEGHDLFHQEKDDMLEAAVVCSRYLQVDDTGARHKGKNGYCTVITNDYFTCFSSTDSKSRVNFLSLLQGRRKRHLLNTTAIEYMKQVRMADQWVRCLEGFGEVHFLNEASWQAFLDDLSLKAPRQRQLATEAVLKAGLIENGFPQTMVIHSDGARQFDTAFAHSGCWYHASRPLAKLIPANARERAARDWMENVFWQIYDDLVEYRQNPDRHKKEIIRRGFDDWVTTQVDYPELRAVLGKLMVIKESLLRVLDCPWLPLHNNLSERQIREYVKRRKISGGTRSALGQKCRDTFASLKKTCRQHGVSFSKYLLDRLSGAMRIPQLAELISGAANTNNQAIASGF
ncbi:MAG: transposase [Candidatus Sedimenticola sp. 1PA]